MRSFLVRKINNFTKALSLRAKVPNTYGARLYTLILFPYVSHIQIFHTFHLLYRPEYLLINCIICGPRSIANFRTVGGKLAISTILLVDLEVHFFRHMFSCSWSSEQHLALCLQCVFLLYCSKIPLFQKHDQTGVLLSMLSLTADHKT